MLLIWTPPFGQTKSITSKQGIFSCTTTATLQSWKKQIAYLPPKPRSQDYSPQNSSSTGKMTLFPRSFFRPRDPTVGTGGTDRGSYFHTPKKIPTSEFVYPKKSLRFWHTPPPNPTLTSKLLLCCCWFELVKGTIPRKIPVFLAIPKNHSVFYKPKKSPCTVKEKRRRTNQISQNSGWKTDTYPFLI